mmetsp:Transcript_32703/g.79296  ORF Transcript_32703/g.79296 Transcript_32703/m.79296 type:complete len:248 (-) Transcript_32703:675-1418(-)
MIIFNRLQIILCSVAAVYTSLPGMLHLMLLLEQSHPVVDTLVQCFMEPSAMDESVNQWTNIVVTDAINIELVNFIPLSQLNGTINVRNCKFSAALQTIGSFQLPFQFEQEFVNVSGLTSRPGNTGMSVQFLNFGNSHLSIRSRRRCRERICCFHHHFLQRLLSPLRTILLLPCSGLVPGTGSGWCRSRHSLSCRCVNLFWGNIANQALGFLRQFIVEIGCLLSVDYLVPPHSITLGENVVVTISFRR